MEDTVRECKILYMHLETVMYCMMWDDGCTRVCCQRFFLFLFLFLWESIGDKPMHTASIAAFETTGHPSRRRDDNQTRSQSISQIIAAGTSNPAIPSPFPRPRFQREQSHHPPVYDGASASCHEYEHAVIDDKTLTNLQASASSLA